MTESSSFFWFSLSSCSCKRSSSAQHGLDNNTKHSLGVGMWSRCELVQIVFWLCQSYVNLFGCADSFRCVLQIRGFFFSRLPLLFDLLSSFPACSHMRHSHGVTAITKGYKRIKTMLNSGQSCFLCILLQNSVSSIQVLWKIAYFTRPSG